MLQVQEQDKPFVFIDNNKPMTDSLIISEAFGKGHDKVLRDIRSLKCSDEFRLANFGESTYTNKQGRNMPLYVLTFDGFAMLAMGYTGEKAMGFKERYINEFNQTRQLLESHKQEQQLIQLQQSDTLYSYEQKQIQSHIRARIINLHSAISDKARRKYYARLHLDLRKQFDVVSFRDIRRCDLEKAIQFIKEWD